MTGQLPPFDPPPSPDDGDRYVAINDAGGSSRNALVVLDLPGTNH
jgi:hypothetical protein